MRIAIIGATGLVGQEVIKVLEERDFPVEELILASSEKSGGKEVKFKGKTYTVAGMQKALSLRPDVAFFAAGGFVSEEWAPKFASAGVTVIDKSSFWRKYDDIPLIVPSVNGEVLKSNCSRIIATPNCSTIQLVIVLAPLHKRFKINRLVISTYQSVSGSGTKGIEQLLNERKGVKGEMEYPYCIDLNLIPHGGNFDANGYTSEETKLVNETRKILNDNDIQITATVVRVPVLRGHSESVNISFEKPFTLNNIYEILSQTSAVKVFDEPEKNVYPMPILSEGEDKVFAGRIRIDNSFPNSLNMWIVADNLRIGAATNAVWIAEYLKETSNYPKFCVM